MQQRTLVIHLFISIFGFQEMKQKKLQNKTFE